MKAIGIFVYNNEFLSSEDGSWSHREEWELERMNNIQQA